MMRLLERAVRVRREEIGPALWSFGYFFCLLASYYVLRPVRDEMGVAGPAREVLFTVVTREEKYKAKNFIDTVVYRGGDAATGWAFAGLTGLGLGLTGIALVAVPLSAGWLAVALWLGRREQALRERATRVDDIKEVRRGAA